MEDMVPVLTEIYGYLLLLTYQAIYSKPFANPWSPYPMSCYLHFMNYKKQKTNSSTLSMLAELLMRSGFKHLAQLVLTPVHTAPLKPDTQKRTSPQHPPGCDCPLPTRLGPTPGSSDSPSPLPPFSLLFSINLSTRSLRPNPCYLHCGSWRQNAPFCPFFKYKKPSTCHPLSC